MKTPTISLAMITNTSKHLAETIGSVASYMDEIVIVDNGNDKQTEKVAKKFKAKYLKVNPQEQPELFCEYPEGKFEPNFTQLRRLSFEACTKDWILWLDTDDIYINAHLIASNLEQAERSGINALNMQYKYEIDENGEVIQVHNKERIVKRDFWKWEIDPDWAVHENLYPVQEKKQSLGMVLDMVVEHRKEDKDKPTSNIRNYHLLMWMLKKEKFQKDPRVWFLLARELMGLNNYEDATKIFGKYLSMEYAPHDALLACIKCSEIAEATGDFKGALAWATRGIGIRPDHPIAYLYAARYLNYQAKSDEALDMIKMAAKKHVSPLDSYTQEPLTMAWLTLTGYVEAYKRKKEYDKLIKVCEENKERFSGEYRKEIDAFEKDANEAKSIEKMLGAIKLLVDNKTASLGRTPTIEDYSSIFDLFDKSIRLSPTYMELRKKTGDFRVHEDNEITIVHMNNFEAWDPETLYKNGGGGSETACIELSNAWAALGYKVTVYAEPPIDNTVFNGVTWRKFETCNFADKFNIFISLRSPSLFVDYKIDANKKYLWLQDVMMPSMYTPDLVDEIDKIIVLSKYHRETGYEVPEGKFYYTTNGINLRLIEEIEKQNIKRVKNKCVYISSSDRGLEPLVKMWPKIKALVPDADLSWAYGWNSWNAFRTDKNAEKYKQSMIKLMKKNGIHELGRISKRDLYRLLLSASYHTYPLIGPAETSCIAVMESQALGAFPITTGITALEETQQWGIKVRLDKYVPATVDTMKTNFSDNEEERAKMMKWARETYDWSKIAKQWVEDLF